MQNDVKSLTLVVELQGDEVDTFLKLSGTYDDHHQRQIAKSLVLGAGEVVNPREVKRRISVLAQIYKFGTSDGERATQDMADAMLYTRAQLNEEVFRRKISLWASHFGDDVRELVTSWSIPVDRQYEWFKLSEAARNLLDELLQQLKAHAVMAD